MNIYKNSLVEIPIKKLKLLMMQRISENFTTLTTITSINVLAMFKYRFIP
jgi:hypothetical protein